MRLGLASILLSLIAAGCYGNSSKDSDGDSNSLTCDAFTSCGGDPNGVWQSESFCTDESLDELIAEQGLPAACEGAMTVTGFSGSTTLEVVAPTYTESGTVTLDWSMRFEASCVSALAGQTVTSAQIPEFCTAFQDQLLTNPDNPFSSLSCQAAGGVCSCVAGQDIPVSTTGSFTVQGETLVFDDGTTQQFCVSGDDLSVHSESTTLGGTVTTYRRMP